MKKLLFMAILLLVACSLFAQFRDSKWGMSIDEVKQTENTEPGYDENNSLGYVDKLLGLDTFVFYMFVDNQLVRAKYMITEKHSNDNLYIEDYNKLKEALNKKYKTSTDDKSYWGNDLYKDDRSHWGFAVSLGHLKYFTQWETQDTNIILALTGDNYEINLVLEYTSKELEGLEEKQKQKEEESKL